MKRDELMALVEKRLNEVKAALETLNDDAAIGVTTLFESWEPDHEYIINERIRWQDKLYRVVQAHTSQTGWEPDSVPALFTEIAKPGEIPEWKQPTGSQDAYNTGDKVRHNGYIWVSSIDGNVWEPGVYGWTTTN